MNTTPNNNKKENKESIETMKFYSFQETIEIKKLLKNVDDLKSQIDSHRPLQDDIWNTIQDKLMIDWNHHSNAIEGNTLTRGETSFFLQYGLTVEGKPFKDYLDVKNHAEAIEYLYEVIKNERQISTNIVKEFNVLLLLGLTYTKAVNQFGEVVKKPVTPGQYKSLPNHVLQPDGTIHYYTEPYQVASEMDYLCNWINENLDKRHPVIVGAVAHYNFVRIHPFDDGNGRGARILMNLILMKKKYPPAIIKVEERKRYIDALMEGDKGILNQFIELVINSLINTQNIILEDLK